MAKQTTFRTRLMVRTGSGNDSYIDIGKLKSVKPPGKSRETIDVNTHDNATDYAEYIASALKEGGEFTAEVMFDAMDTTHVQGQNSLDQLAESGETKYWRIIVPKIFPMVGWEFQAFITNLEPGDMNVNEPMSTSVTWKVTGSNTFGAFSWT